MMDQRYETIKLIGKGRIGSVYEAEDTVLGRKVALRRFFDSDEIKKDPERESNFVKLAQSLGSFQHPGILTVFDAGVDEEGVYITSELLEGESLNKRLMRGAVNEWNVYQMVEAVLDSLSIAHQSGFIHGAINPSSVMRVPRVSGGYRSLLVDLGLNDLMLLSQGDELASSPLAEPIMMAPEMFDGQKATELSDIYMLGQFAYICLVGGHPFAGKSIEEAAKAHLEEELKPLHEYELGISKEFSDWVHSLIQKEPSNRPQSAVEALKTLPSLKKPVDHDSIMESMGKLEDLTGKIPGSEPSNNVSELQTLTLLSSQQSNPTTSVIGKTSTNISGGVLTSQSTGVLNQTSSCDAQSTGVKSQVGSDTFVNKAVKSESRNGLLIGVIAFAGACVLALIAVIIITSKPKAAVENDSEENILETIDITSLEEEYEKQAIAGNEAVAPVDSLGIEISSKVDIHDPQITTEDNKIVSKAKVVRIHANSLDYLFFNKNKSFIKSDRVNNIFNTYEKIGAFNYVNIDAKYFRFLDFSGGRKKGFRSELVGGAIRSSKFRVGEGFSVLGEIPSEQMDQIKFNIYFSQKNCKVQLKFEYIDRAGEEWSDTYVSVDSANTVELAVSNPIPGERFKISLINQEVTNEVYRMIFHGIVALQ